MILRRALELLGGDVTHFIPERLRDGYGLQPATIERLHADGAQVIVSVDCGIRAPEAARRAAELGVDLIITDHHEPDERAAARRWPWSIPSAPTAAIPTSTWPASASRSSWCRRSARRPAARPGCRRSSRSRPSARSPTSCRWSARTASSPSSACEMLTRGPHKVGLRALLDVAGLSGKTIDAYHIAFMVAPRVNAAGRMATRRYRDPAAAGRRRGAGRRGAGAGPAARRREHPAPRGGAGHRRRGPQDRRHRSRRRRASGAGRGRRGLAPRRHRHRRLEAGRRLLPAGDRAVDRGRRGPRLVPQHPGLRHAGARSSRARRCCSASAATSRRRACSSPPPTSRRSGARSTPMPSTGSGPTTCGRSSTSTARCGFDAHHAGGRRAADGDGAVRDGQPEAAVHRRRRSTSSTARAGSRSAT